jgi:hypothetical protein
MQRAHPKLKQAVWVFPIVLAAQMPQNPSPMVEHTRPHPRLAQATPLGTRHALEIGSLYVPPKLNSRRTLLVFFHGGKWLPEVAGAKYRMAVISVQAGAGSGTYARAFADPSRFRNLLADAEAKADTRFGRVILAGWSAGCGAIRELLRAPEIYSRADAVLCIDGIHTGYRNGKPGPLESDIETEQLDIWERFAKDAMARRKQIVITHSEIFPGTFASTTETADYLLHQLGLRRRPLLKQGPMGTQQLSEVRSGGFRLIGYAGNSAPDHVDQLHSLLEYLKWLR